MSDKLDLKYNIGRKYPREIIKRLQAECGICPQDGIWDLESIPKIKAWQTSKGLNPDGRIGPNTYKAMTEDWEDTPTKGSDTEAFTKARSTNEGHSTFLCPITWKVIDLASDEGVSWVKHIQDALALKPDGEFGPKTEKEFTHRYGPLTMEKQTLHPMPLFVRRWRYDHAHDWDSPEWPYRDPEWERVTSGGSWEDGMLRLVSGYNPKNGTTSRPGRSFITLDHYSISFSHYFSGNAGPFLAYLMEHCPKDAIDCFGADKAEKMKNPRYILKMFKKITGQEGRVKHYPEMSWLSSGWWAFGSRPAVVQASADFWLGQYTPRGVQIAKKLKMYDELRGENGGQLLAACTRLANSAPGLAPIWFKNAKPLAKSNSSMDRMEACFFMEKKREVNAKTGKKHHVGGYGHGDRWVSITNWPEFKGPAPKKWLK